MSSEQARPSNGVALVTGSANGIGRTIAFRLARDGYDIVLNDLAVNEADLDAVKQGIIKEYQGRRVCVVVADVSIEEQVKNMVDSTVAALGSLDVVVANAGIAIPQLIADTTVEDLDNILAVNVRGTFLCYKYAAQKMINLGIKGRIIGASSQMGKRGAMFMGGYSASKFAVRGLTQTAAVEFGRHGITVNAYAPGPIETPMVDRFKEEIVRYVGDPNKGFFDPIVKMSALGRMGSTKDIANLVSFLASPESSYMTGQTISIDGGLHFD